MSYLKIIYSKIKNIVLFFYIVPSYINTFFQKKKGFSSSFFAAQTSENRQLIQLICNYVSTNVYNFPIENRLAVARQDTTPDQIHRGNLTQKTALKTEHEGTTF